VATSINLQPETLNPKSAGQLTALLYSNIQLPPQVGGVATIAATSICDVVWRIDRASKLAMSSGAALPREASKVRSTRVMLGSVPLAE